jgi:hypothetical protein
MDTTFINGLLLTCILVILLVYLYQSTPAVWNNSSVKNVGNNAKGEAFFPVIFDTCPGNRVSGMPVHRVGPVHNFHQHFNKYSKLLTCSKNPASIPEKDTKCINSYPTGIPEMGWRNFYLANFSKNEIPTADPFAGTNFRNFLNNMENVDNIYRKC